MKLALNDDAVAWLLPGLLAVGGLVAFGWSAEQAGDTASDVGQAAGTLTSLLAGSIVMSLGAFLVGVSVFRNSFRFIPLGINLMIIGFPFLGIDWSSFGGTA